MDAAKAAARTFVQQQPSSIEIGVVAFSDGGLVTLPPTRSDDEVLAAIDRLVARGDVAGAGHLHGAERDQRYADHGRARGARG